MASRHPKAKKIARYALSGLLVTGMVCVTGFLSFTGMLVLNGPIYFAIVSFFLAGGIEGEVYAQNINASLLKLFTANYWNEVILDQALKKLLQLKLDTDLFNDTDFFNDYNALQEYIHELEEAHDHNNDQALKEARKKLKWMKHYFRDFIMSDEDTSDASKYPYHNELNEALTVLLEKENKKSSKKDFRHDIRQKIKRKILLSRLAWILNISAGISCFLVGLDAAQASITAVSAYFSVTISGAALSASIFGLAIIGALGYVLLIHNTITDMIKNETLQKWAAETLKFFKRQEKKSAQAVRKESNLEYAFRVTLGFLMVSAIVGLGVFTTAATAGTWWYAAKAGAKLLPRIAQFAGRLWALAITVSSMAVTSLLFGVVNSLQSVNELAQISLRKSWGKITTTIEKYEKAENWAQRLNPFRLLINVITIPFTLFVGIGHLFSMGSMGNNLNHVDPRVTTIVNTTYEFTQDAHYFLPEDTHHSHEHEEGHAHTNILGKILKAGLSPLYLLTSLWDYSFSRFNPEGSPGRPILSFKAARTKAWHGLQDKPKRIEKPALSEKWSTKWNTDEGMQKEETLASTAHFLQQLPAKPLRNGPKVARPKDSKTRSASNPTLSSLRSLWGSPYAYPKNQPLEEKAPAAEMGK